MRHDAFNTPPQTATPEDAAPPELPGARMNRYLAKLVEEIGEGIRWQQINRNTEQSQIMVMADHRVCCIQRKTVAGPTGPVVTMRVLVEGNDVYDAKSLEGVVNLLSITSARKTRR